MMQLDNSAGGTLAMTEEQYDERVKAINQQLYCYVES